MHLPHIFIPNGNKICATEETEGMETKKGWNEKEREREGEKSLIPQLLLYSGA